MSTFAKVGLSGLFVTLLLCTSAITYMQRSAGLLPKQLRTQHQAISRCGGGAWRDDVRENSGTHAQFRCYDGTTIPAYQ